MLVATNFVSAPKTYADGPIYCTQWVTQYRSQLVNGQPRLALVPDGWGHLVWRWVATSYYTTVPVQVCVNYQSGFTGQIVYANNLPSIYDGNYFRYGYFTQSAYYT